MTDEGIWLLLFGGGWVEFDDIKDEHEEIFDRLAKAKKLDVDENLVCIRLKETQ